MTPLHTIEEIKEAVNQGKTVYAGSSIYKVKKDKNNKFYIVCTLNNYCIGLHGQEGTPSETKLNARDFFTADI